MPESRLWILNFVCSTPVTVPAIIPPKNPDAVANTGLMPATIIVAAIAAPSVMEPSAVMSAM